MYGTVPITYPDEEVEEFYERLELEIINVDSGDILVVMGDFNSKVGDDPSGYEDVIGEAWLVENERRERMLEFCRKKQLLNN